MQMQNERGEIGMGKRFELVRWWKQTAQAAGPHQDKGMHIEAVQ
jgi:hypothetical protein